MMKPGPRPKTPVLDPAIQIHRFRDMASLSITNTGGSTVYLDETAILRLAGELHKLAQDIRDRSSSESRYIGRETIYARRKPESD